ncbi:MAG: flagellar biosynthesis protein FlgJ [Firmicutes bacterium]|nr:flagellar biosynthesis protein FlgJ [Bacillota bacterium]
MEKLRVAWDPNMPMLDRANQASEKAKSLEQLKKASQEFEALFLQQLLSEMRKSVPDSKLFGDRKAEKLFESMLDQEMSLEMSKIDSLGLAKLIYEQMKDYVK